MRKFVSVSVSLPKSECDCKRISDWFLKPNGRPHKTLFCFQHISAYFHYHSNSTKLFYVLVEIILSPETRDEFFFNVLIVFQYVINSLRIYKNGF